MTVLLAAAWYLVTDYYGEQEKQLRVQLRETIRERFPEESSEYAARFGLERLEQQGRPCSEDESDRGSVVLVHGLDDPGLVWRNLAPELCERGFDVWLMEYPNDQPIVESARLLSEELRQLADQDIDRISIVAHSMGGLVAREMLTSPDESYAALARDGVVPEVGTLIMVGTPNHGSPMARYRVLAEWRDQLSRMAEGDASWLGGILDGAGEARIDLLPGSLFLTELNHRPHPKGVEMLVIAGVASPWSDAEIRRWVADQSRDASEDQQRRLEGIEHRTVDGTHLTMIRTLRSQSQRIPPAIPIIIGRLTVAAGTGNPP